MGMFDDLIPEGNKKPSSTGLFDDLVPEKKEQEESQPTVNRLPGPPPASIGRDQEAQPQTQPVPEESAPERTPFQDDTSEALPYDAQSIDEFLQQGAQPGNIVDRLLQQGARRLQVGEQQFDLAAAREAGVDDREIVNILVTGEGWEEMPEGVMGYVDAGLRGVNTAIANTFGAPADLLNNAPRALNLIPGVDDVGPISDYPIGGSESIRDGMGLVGTRTYEDLEDLPPSYRPAAVSGEVVGSSAPVVGSAGVAARTVPRMAPDASTSRRVGDSLIEPFRNNPGRAAIAEGGSTLGAAQGGYWAYTIAPENPLVQTGAEVLAGMANPVELTRRTVRGTYDGISRFVRTYLSEEGSKTEASKALNRAIVDLGEDPEEIAGVLQNAAENPVEGVDLTAGQASGSRSLLALENRLAQKSQEFYGYREESINTAFRTLRESADALASTGNPEALRVAARMRQKYFKDIVAARMAQANTEASEAAARFSEADSVEASVRVQEVTDNALDDVRSIERSLWESIPGETQLDGENTIAALDDLRSTLLAEESPPGLAEAFVRRVAGDDEDAMTGMMDADGSGPEFQQSVADSMGVGELTGEGGTNAGELLRFRSRMLSLGRDARSRGENDLARQFEKMADGALADLETIELPGAEEARSFSRILNQTFRTQNMERVAGRTRTGSPSVRPEETLDESFGRGRTRGDLNLQEMENAARLADESNANIAGRQTQYAEETGQNIDEFIRGKVEDLRDPTTGELSEQKLNRFVQQNPRLLERYPNLKADIEAAASSSRTVTEAGERAKQAQSAIDNRAVFSRLVEDEDPSRVVKGALEGNRPMAEYGQISRLAQRNGEEAVEGLKASTMDYAFRRSTNERGDFSPLKFRESLLDSPNARGESVLDTMVNNGVMNTEEAGRLRRIVDEMARLTDTQQFSQLADESRVNPASSAIFDFTQRLIGASAGGASALANVSGSQLVLAGAGVRTAQRIMDKIPRGKVMDVLVEASKSPQATADLLNRTPTPRLRQERDTRLNAFLIQQGIITPDEERDEYPSEVPEIDVPLEGYEETDETSRMLEENEVRE